MGGLFYNLGKLAGPKIRKAKWAYLAATAPEAEVIEAEYVVGSDMAAVIRKQCQLMPGTEQSQLLSEIGTKLAGRIKNKRRQFSFECFHNPQPQAFCLPGGFIFVSDSIIELCGRNTNQIAFILSHELAHIIEGHVMERMLANALIKVVSRTGHVRAAAAVGIKQLGVDFLESAYSQENELRADAFGVHLAKAGGYDRAAAIDLFLQLEPLEQKKLLGKYFSTHPNCQTRISHIKNLLSENTT